MFTRRYRHPRPRSLTRRQLLRAGVGVSIGHALTGGAVLGANAPAHASTSARTPSAARENHPNETFPLGVASADPTTNGMVFWTHLSRAHQHAGEPLLLEVAEDDHFDTLTLTQSLSGDAWLERDGCATVIIDNALQPDRYYWYRFHHAGKFSRTGRCRTLPLTSVSVKPLRIGVVNCQEFSNGYYGAYRHLAGEENLAFVLHLGDSIYERIGGKAYLQHPHLGRNLALPSGGDIAVDLSDYRSLYRQYRADPDYQDALAMHTFVFQLDDHEVTNNTYWNATQDVMGVADHPFGDVTRYPDSVERLRHLRAEALRAWSEYMPSRLQYGTSDTRPTLYRRMMVGDVSLLLMDSRSYRSRPPCKKTMLPLGCHDYEQTELTLLGAEQRDWLVAQLQDPTPRWTVLASQVALSRIAVGNPRAPLGVANTDAWDGYAHEREALMKAVHSTQQGRFVVLSGDMHASLVGMLQAGELAPSLPDAEQIMGIEFMSPPVSSPATIDLLFPRLRTHPFLRKLTADMLEAGFGWMNPQLPYISIQTHGYSVISLDENGCHWQAKVVDIDVPAEQSSLRVAAEFHYAPGA
jgi:alkaline phosphatase D